MNHLEELIREAVERMATASRDCDEEGCTHGVTAGARNLNGSFTLGIDDHRVFAAELAAKLERLIEVENQIQARAVEEYARSPEHAAHLRHVAEGPTRMTVEVCPTCLRVKDIRHDQAYTAANEAHQETARGWIADRVDELRRDRWTGRPMEPLTTDEALSPRRPEELL